MQYEIIELNEKTAAGFCARTSNLSPDMGQIIGGLWQQLYAPDGCGKLTNRTNAKSLGIYTDYAADERGEYTVMAGCEVNSEDVPAGFTVRRIPAGRYARFIVRGHMVRAVHEFWQKLWQMELDRSFVCDFEEYQNADTENAEIHIYISLHSS